ncbi:STAS domain-containing protein [Nocardia sp. CDC159]|uniref:STAS domain-containing protein n=1 Tax=Nocardia pulmonis TaxID=2951408 RepID=A0A9X2E656_9NOCA|nr:MULTISPECIES: STAS domain-containing protein [Nocardia]MCM6775047.1 STAS domain-containing protein [Nocardia pulmonis]MCM6789517.1 STAS domain-containing protein [Nocardia sp. CDC159]
MTRAAFELHTDGLASAPPTVTVTGEVDVTNAHDFAESIAALPGRRPLLLELSRLGYLDSAGFAALDRLLADDAVVLVLAPDSPIRRAAELVDLPFHGDTAAAARTLP